MGKPMKVDAPDDLGRNEIRFEGELPIDKVNGWECGQLAQKMGKHFRENYTGKQSIVRATLRLSVYLATGKERTDG